MSEEQVGLPMVVVRSVIGADPLVVLLVRHQVEVEQDLLLVVLRRSDGELRAGMDRRRAVADWIEVDADLERRLVALVSADAGAEVAAGVMRRRLRRRIPG